MHLIVQQKINQSYIYIYHEQENDISSHVSHLKDPFSPRKKSTKTPKYPLSGQFYLNMEKSIYMFTTVDMFE